MGFRDHKSTAFMSITRHVPAARDPTVTEVTESTSIVGGAVVAVTASSSTTAPQPTAPFPTDQEHLIEPLTDTPFDNESAIAQWQTDTSSLSAMNQEPSISHDEMMPTEAIANESLHVGSNYIAAEPHDESKDDDISATSNHLEEEIAEGSEIKKTDEKEEEKSDSFIISESQSEEFKQNNDSIDRQPEEISASSQSLTKRLIASGGDIRALLSSDQPLSTMQAQSDDTGKADAGQKIGSKDNDEEEDEEEEDEERFVRPPRLRVTLSDEAASDGFPSAIALSLRWHPDHMQDRPGEAANLSIRAAFDTKYDEHYVFRDWRPSQGTPFDLFFLVSAL